MNIYQKLHAIQSEINGLGKNASANSYQYVSGDKVLSHIKPLMKLHNLLLKQEILSIENTRQDYVVGVSQQNPSGRQKSEINSKVMMRFTWVDCDSGEKDENLFGSNGQNDWDKGVGSALTYAERYFLLKFFHIATDEDDIDNPRRKELEETPVQIAIGNVRLMMSVEELEAFWKSQTQEIQKDKTFIAAVKARKTQLTKQ